VLRRLELEELQRIARDDDRQRQRLLLLLFVVTALAVDAKEAVEDDASSVRAKHILARLDVETRVLEARRRHLRREHALPDERVELELIRLQVLLQIGRRP